MLVLYFSLFKKCFLIPCSIAWRLWAQKHIYDLSDMYDEEFLLKCVPFSFSGGHFKWTGPV